MVLDTFQEMNALYPIKTAKITKTTKTIKTAKTVKIRSKWLQLAKYLRGIMPICKYTNLIHHLWG
jgi:hypothetical protein